MARRVSAAAIVAGSLWCSSARAIPRDNEVRAPKVEEPEPPETDGPPEARTGGMTTAFRTGVALPFGRVASGPGNGMPNVHAYQVPLLVETGYRVTPHLSIGGFLGLAFGDVGGELRRLCSGCSTRSFRIGVLSQVFLRPAERLDPWVGLGIGYESVTILNGASSVTLSGPEYVHVLAGLDVRSSRKVGFGPYVDASLGVYTDSVRLWSVAGPVGIGTAPRSSEENIHGKALHGWVTAGLRLVLYP